MSWILNKPENHALGELMGLGELCPNWVSRSRHIEFPACRVALQAEQQSSLVAVAEQWSDGRVAYSKCPLAGIKEVKQRHPHLETGGRSSLEESVEEVGAVQAAFATYAALVRRCGNEGALAEGRRVHSRIIRSGWDHVTYLGNLLVEMYGRCTSVVDAVSVFEKIRRPSIVSWTLVIVANAQNGHSVRALEFFWRMLLEGVRPDAIAFVGILEACAMLHHAKAIHALVVDGGFDLNIVVGNALINAYKKCGSLADAKTVFDRMRETDVITWTSMIAAYAQNGHHAGALELFWKMELEGVAKPNGVTFITLLDASSSVSNLAYGKLLHARIAACGFDLLLVVGNSLINMYSRCGDLEAAKSVFDRMPVTTAVSWTAMLVAYAQKGHCREALTLFRRMDVEGVKPDMVTFVSVVDACACGRVLSQAEAIHARIAESGWLDSSAAVGSALINMYGKCGSLESARNVFEKMQQKNVVSWTALITIHAQDGDGIRALELFKDMNLDGTRPNGSTFASVLFACTHQGLLHGGRDYFLGMERDHVVIPCVEHYTGMVDLLGRAGMLEQAEELINSMPYQPDSVIWMTLLTACWMHSDEQHGAVVADRVFQMDPGNEAPYVLLSNIYAAAGKSDAAAKLRRVMEDRLLTKRSDQQQ